MPATTEWGGWIGYGTGSMEKVLIKARRPMTEDEIMAAVRANGDTGRGAPQNHLYTLQRRGYIISVDGRWGRPELFGRPPQR